MFFQPSPLVYQDPDHPLSRTYTQLSDHIIKTVIRQIYSPPPIPDISFDTKRGVIVRIFHKEHAEEYVLSPIELKRVSFL